MPYTFASRRALAVFQILLTAGEAYPALEREFLRAQDQIWAAFRVFDPTTALRSPEARAIGRTWLDLVQHTLARGVAISLVITDFDPLGRPGLHRGTWRSARLLIAAAEMAGAGDRLRVIPAMHPAEMGLLPRIAFWPVILSRQLKAARWLNRLDEAERRAALRDMPGSAQRLERRADGRLRPRFWPLPQVYPATHHQKLAVFDRSCLYIGGLDLDERRYDTPEHRRSAAQTWHDVQLLVDGPAAAEAQAHLESFLDITGGRRPAGPGMRHVFRTLSRRRARNLLHFGPEPLVQEITIAHEHYARRARRLIYMETQFFRDARFAQQLARIARENPALGMILVLPGAPEDVAFLKRFGADARYGEFLQARALRILGHGFGKRLFVASAAQPRADDGDAEAPHNRTGRDRLHDAPLVYIHAKVSIFDDSAAIVSSANLNGRSMRWDTEAGLLLAEPTRVRALSRRVMEHWLPDDADEACHDPVRAVAAWRALALENVRRPPDARRGFVLPYDVKAAEAVAAALPIVPEETV